jgi:hypothetical protein
MKKYPISIFLSLCLLGMAEPDSWMKFACAESAVEIFKKYCSFGGIYLAIWGDF